MKGLGLVLALAAAAGAARAATYQDEITLRLWFVTGAPNLYDARVSVHDENSAMAAAQWGGAIPEDALARGNGGGAEGSWGLTPEIKLVAALLGFGTSAAGTFTGQGPGNTLSLGGGAVVPQLADRLDRLSYAGGEVGATFLMRELNEWSRAGVTLRVGGFSLAGSLLRGHEHGPLRDYWWERDLSGAAPSAFLGLEWEWNKPVPSFPITGFVLAGYRVLQFRNVSFAYTDTTGVTLTGGYNTPTGGHVVLDFSGAELRAGIQLILPGAAAAESRVYPATPSDSVGSPAY